MAQYCDNFTFRDNDNDSFEFWNGLRGPAGPAGAPGPPGSSVELRGPVATVGDLPATAPADELWMVGAENPYTGYFWNGTSWIDLGAILQGPQGEPGEDGVSPVVTITAITGGHEVTITDEDHPTGQTFNVMDGEEGTPGTAAGFGTPTATVNSSVGTPSVTVTASGPDTAKVFSFAFSNLKGEPGSGGGSNVSVNAIKTSGAKIATITVDSTTTSLYATDISVTPQYSTGTYIGRIMVDGSTNNLYIPSIPAASTSAPLMDGTATTGTATSWAREDHVHPSDTSKLATDGDGSDVTVAFTASSSRTNISTGEKLSVLMGKIAKFFTDLKTAAFKDFTGYVTQGSTKLVESGAVYDALAGKAASDLGVTGATANQYVQITAVDANGKPTAFGAGTPSGGDALYLTGVAISATTGDIATVSNNAITADHVLVSCVFADPAAITADITWTTAAGSLTLNGTCSTATTASIVFVKKSN